VLVTWPGGGSSGGDVGCLAWAGKLVSSACSDVPVPLSFVIGGGVGRAAVSAVAEMIVRRSSRWICTKRMTVASPAGVTVISGDCLRDTLRAMDKRLTACVAEAHILPFRPAVPDHPNVELLYPDRGS
jgi:hypothetical protein